MTEPTLDPSMLKTQVAPETVAPVEQTIDGTIPAPVAEEGTVEAGLEVKVRSQWSYARNRFFRHRLAMAGLLPPR